MRRYIRAPWEVVEPFPKEHSSQTGIQSALLPSGAVLAMEADYIAQNAWQNLRTQ